MSRSVVLRIIRRRSTCFPGILCLTLAVLCKPTIAGANDLPVKQNPDLAHFGYYFADWEVNHDFLGEVRPQANLYVAIPTGYSPDAPFNPTQFKNSLTRAVQLNMDIWLMAPTNPTLLASVLQCFKDVTNSWSRVKYLQVLAETDQPRAVTDAAVDAVQAGISAAALSYAGKLFGVEFQRCVAQGRVRLGGVQDLCGASDPMIDDARFSTKIQFVAIQAYADAYGSPNSANNVAEVNTVINTARSRLPLDKKLILIGQGYDRNGTWTNSTNPANATAIETLKDLQKQYYLQAYAANSRVLAVVMFAYARWSPAGKVLGGARVHPELIPPHIQMAERIHGDQDADGDGLRDMWERQTGLSVGVNDAGGDPDGDGLTNLAEMQQGRHPTAASSNRRYLAEGSQNSFFTTWIGVANPGTTDARVLLRFLTTTSGVKPLYLYVPKQTRMRVYADTVGLQSQDFAIEVESDQRVTVDRTVRWDATGYGGHSETASATPQNTWYFAEGVTSDPFALFYLIVNPNAIAVNAQITYVREGTTPVVRTYAVPANSRSTIEVDADPLLASGNMGAIVQSLSGGPIIVERAQYLHTAQAFGAGHDGLGAPAASNTWFLAEGATGGYFDLYVPIANPNTFPVSVTATYVRNSGAPVIKTYSIPAQQRITILVDGEDPLLANAEVSTKLDASAPIVAERVMWWPQGAWHEAHCSMGVTQTGTRWLSADGEEGGVASQVTYILVANVATINNSIRVTLLNGEHRTNAFRDYLLGPQSRISVNIGLDFGLPPGRRAAVLVESLSGAQMVVERAMYWNAGGVMWAAGTSAPADRLF